jgi:hypothetical protein
VAQFERDLRERGIHIIILVQREVRPPLWLASPRRTCVGVGSRAAVGGEGRRTQDQPLNARARARPICTA